MNTPNERACWPTADGEMATRICTFDWASTPLGPIERWPQSLTTAVDMMLATPQAMWVAWGPELIQLYNDQYIPLLDEARHPSILGSPAAESWADSWHPWGPAVQSILAGGPPVSYTDRRVHQRNGGDLRDHYFTYSYSPIPDSSAPAGVGGVLCVSVDITSSIALHESEERQAFLLRLSDALRPLSDPIAVQETAARMLGEHLGVSSVAYGEVVGDEVVVIGSYVAEGARAVAGRYHMVDYGEAPVAAMREGHPVVMSDIATSRQLSAAEQAAYAAMGIAALAGVPLVKDGRFVAYLNVHHREPREWTDNDLALLEETAERTWDAVERARAEEALRSSEERFRAVWEETSEALAISDPEGTVLAVNPSYCELYGFDEDEVVGHSFTVIFPEEDRAWAREQYRAVFTMPEPPPAYESRVRRKGGGERVVESRADFVVEHGQRVAMISAIRDVTDRVTAEAALREGESHLRALVAATSYITYRMSPDWSELRHLDGRGFLADTDEPSMNWLEGYIEPEDRPQVLAAIEAAIQAKSVFELEHRVRRADGTVGWTLSRAVPILDADGEIVEWFGAASDVTERKQGEAALRESEEAYRTLFTSMDQGFCVMEKVDTAPGQPSDYRFISANPAFARHTGLHDVVGRTVLEVVPGANTGVLAICDDVVRTGVSRQFEANVSSMHLWVDAEVVPAHVPGRIAVVFSDISERKRAEIALRESEERQAFLLGLSDTVRSLSDAVGIQGEACRHLGEYLNADRTYYGEMDTAHRMVRVWRDYARGDAPSLVGTYDFETYRTVMEHIGAGETWVVDDVTVAQDLSLEERALLTDLEVNSWVDVPLFKQEKLVAVLCVTQREARQWTDGEVRLVEELAERIWVAVERARAEEALRESEERYRTLFTSMEQGFCIIEKVPTPPDEPIDFRYVTANPAFARHTGLHDAVGRTIRELVPGVEPEIMGIYDDVAQTGRHRRFEARVGGLGIWIEGEAMPAQEPGQVAVLFSNISDRKHTEEQLRASEQRLQRMINIEGVGVLTFGMDGTLISANDHFLAMTGYDRETVARGEITWRAMTPPEFVAISELQMQRMEREGRIGPYEKEYLRADGGRSWMLFAGASLGDGTIVEYCIDVGDRKRAEAALRESEARQTFLLRLGDALQPLDEPVEIEEVACRLLAEHLIAGHPAVSARAEDPEPVTVRFVVHDRSTLSAGRAFVSTDVDVSRHVSESVRSAYRAHGIRAIASIPLVQGGVLAASLGVISSVVPEWTPNDIWLFRQVAERILSASERARGDRALQESEARFRTVANMVPDLLWQSAPDGSADWFNDRWYVYTGQWVKQAAGWGWLDAIHPEDRARTRADYARALGHGEPLRLEFRLRGEHGGYRWFLAHAEPLRDAGGMIVGWFGASTDVHEARMAREELQHRVSDATAELRALSQRLLVVQEEERRHLARELHDEIGQVLTGLSLNLRPGMVIDDRRLEEARRIVHDLTNQVRQLSMDLRPSALDTHGLLPALVWHIERYQERTGVRIDLRHEGMDRRFPPAVEITAYRIVQEALTNVARHAGVRDATVQLLATDGTLVVSVRDRGRGVDPDASSDSGGLGGMRERVRLVGGTLSIDTAPGEGTAVTAELPVDDNGSPGTNGAER